MQKPRPFCYGPFSEWAPAWFQPGGRQDKKSKLTWGKPLGKVSSITHPTPTPLFLFKEILDQDLNFKTCHFRMKSGKVHFKAVTKWHFGISTL